MEPSLIQFIFLLFVAALYLPVIFFAIQRRDEGHAFATWLVVLYALIAMVINLAEAFWQDQSDGFLFVGINTYIAFTLVAVLMIALQAFLKNDVWWVWVGFWLFWGLGLALILTNALDLSEVVWTNGNFILYRSRLGPAWAILGWLILIIAMILNLSNANRQIRQPLLRNRLNYWFAPIFLTLLGDVLLFSGVYITTQPLRWFTAISMAYVVGTHYVPDLKNILRQALIYFLSTVAIISFYVGVFLFIQAVFGRTANYNPVLVGALIVLLIMIISVPFRNFVTKTVTKWMKGDQYDASVTIHEYSQSISNILDMDRLASIAVGIMLEAMQLERGFLFLVDTERQADGKRVYKIRSARSPEERQIVAVELQEDGIIASYLTREAKPLLQYDLDLLPAFRNASLVERNWFAQLHTEVYVPIFAKKQWIGLLAFGAKLSGNRFTKEDLNVLSAHANQTAVALENARLVDNLMSLNQELRSARRALERNNQELQRIDQAKSDFISIASHELRTPLTVMKGYTEMMMEDDRLDNNLKNMVKKMNEGTMRLHEIMDSMFDVAQIDSRSLKPHLQPVDLGKLIQDVCIEQSKTANEREQKITVALPPLPQVKADPNLLKKMFHHLIRNAIKFTPNGGKITVIGNQIPPVINLPNGGVEITIIDTGVGVDPNLREIIFTKFYQPGELGKHSTSKSRFKGGGAGLGLALSKGIIEAHGGKIWVESPGYDEVNFPGSQFHIILPLEKLENGQSHKMSDGVKYGIKSENEVRT
ncbi:MAG: GAF domain-containing protein [Anaerolineales bacterium]|nr:GAF domain-containing protein [Anaerolineales bacterium]